jgi:hypothetical protein
MRCDSVVGFTRLKIELNGGHLQTPRFWLHPIMFLRLTYCAVTSKLRNLRQRSWVSKQIIYIHLNCRVSAFALAKSYSQIFEDVERYVLYENMSIMSNFEDILESLTQ